LRDIIVQAPFRRMRTPGGHQMSVAMTNCGDFGWVTDRSGYRYDAVDPLSGRAWPPMPRFFCSSPHGLPSARISPDFDPMSA
jgi:alkylated DNA repair protein (DNA oxidative demethylase)